MSRMSGFCSFRNGPWQLALLFVTSLVARVEGADLRTSVNDRPLVRQVSYILEEPAIENEPEQTNAKRSNSAGKSGTQSKSKVHSNVKQASHQVEAMPVMENEMNEEWVEPTAMDFEYCGPCVLGNGTWADLDVLIWWRREHAFPALATTSPNNTAFANAGVLPNATVLFGSEGEGGESRPGGRVNFGLWLDPCQRVGVGGRFYAVDDETFRFSQTSAGNPILAMPFFDRVLNRENSLVLAFPTAPDQRSGSLTITGTSEFLGSDAYLRFNLGRGCNRRVDFVAGYQMSRIDEEILIQASSTVPGGNAPFRQDPQDLFATQNEFHGGTIGWISEIEGGSWKLSSLVKVGFGNMTETVIISGRNEIRVPPASQQPNVLAEGLFTQTTNIGRFEQSEFVVAPEINVNWTCHVTERFDVSVGYSFLYWSNVAQPGQHIDRRIDETGLQPFPAFAFNTQNYWVYGVNLGAQFRF